LRGLNPASAAERAAQRNSRPVAGSGQPAEAPPPDTGGLVTPGGPVDVPEALELLPEEPPESDVQPIKNRRAAPARTAASL
jgi:hypothetical protein